MLSSVSPEFSCLMILRLKQEQPNMHSGRRQWRGPLIEHWRLRHTQPILQNSWPHSGNSDLSLGYWGTFKTWLGSIWIKTRVIKTILNTSIWVYKKQEKRGKCWQKWQMTYFKRHSTRRLQIHSCSIMHTSFVRIVDRATFSLSGVSSVLLRPSFWAPISIFNKLYWNLVKPWGLCVRCGCGWCADNLKRHKPADKCCSF